MAGRIDKISKKRVASSYVSTVMGVSLVLFMVGIIAWMLLGAGHLKSKVKESISIDLFFNEQAPMSTIKEIEQTLKNHDFVKDANYIAPEQAFDDIKDEIGEDALDLLEGVNPLLPSITVFMNESHAHLDSVEKFEKEIKMNCEGQLHEVAYQSSRFKDINENLNKWVFFVLAIALLLLIIAIAMINNTIRLAIYSKRFTIRTMQFVGARPWFIKKPFLWQSLLQGVVSGILAIALIMAMLMIAENYFPDISLIADSWVYLQLFGLILLLGMLISWFSTFFALRKFIRIRTDALYD